MIQLDKEEQEMLDSFERGEWESVANEEEEIKRYQNYAAATFKKEARVDIHLSKKDLEALQKRALEEGIPYQMLMSSILHKFISGRLVEIQR
ncbi:MAG: antitoxin [Chloroflexota bacterium]